MRILFLFAWLLVVPLTTVTAQDNREGARLTFNDEIHDFGDIVQGEQVSHIFKFRNAGNQQLVISNVLTTCGCTVPEWPKEPVAPGETGQLEVKFDSKGKSGKQNKVITIISNALNPQTRITIRANILPKR